MVLSFFKNKLIKEEFPRIEKTLIPNDKEVSFDDINLEVYMRKVTKIEKGPIMWSDIYNVKKLDFMGWPLLSIRGIEYASSLEDLVLHQSKMNNISFLAKLPNLKRLILSWSDSISEVRSLTGLKNLEELSLYCCSNISNIPILAEITSLKILDISETNINTLDFINELINLDELNVSKNNLSEIRFSDKMINLRHLDISANKISDFSSLVNLKNLEWLDISVNKCTDITFLKELPNLKFVDIRGLKLNHHEKDVKSVLGYLGSIKCHVKK